MSTGERPRPIMGLSPLSIVGVVMHGDCRPGPAIGLTPRRSGHHGIMLTLLLIIVVLVLLFGGGGFYYRGRGRRL